MTNLLLKTGLWIAAVALAIAILMVIAFIWTGDDGWSETGKVFALTFGGAVAAAWFIWVFKEG